MAPRYTSAQATFGLDVIEDNTVAYIRLLTNAETEMSKTVAEKIAGSMRASMRGSKSGRKYTRQGISYQASSPGEAPATRPKAWHTSFYTFKLKESRTKRGIVTKYTGTGSFFKKHLWARRQLGLFTSLSSKQKSIRGLSVEQIDRMNAITQGHMQGFLSALEDKHGFRGTSRRLTNKKTGKRRAVHGYSESSGVIQLIDSIKTYELDKSSYGISMDQLGLALELGTPRVSPRPFIIPAVEKWRPEIPKLWIQYMAKEQSVIHRGVSIKGGSHPMAGFDTATLADDE